MAKYIKTPVINSVEDIPTMNLQPGQWIKFAWCDKPSVYFAHTLSPIDGHVSYVGAYHFPGARAKYIRHAKATKSYPAR